ncbi:MAG: hypothetical protein ACI9FJ_002531 [Alteromonadaceae bacterium]|jgi:hypothetical protein
MRKQELMMRKLWLLPLVACVSFSSVGAQDTGTSAAKPPALQTADSLTPELAPAPSATDILMNAERLRGAETDGLVMTVKIDDVGTNTPTQVMKVSAKGDKSLVEFMRPKKQQGRKILMVGNNMWFVSPSVRKPIPISTRQRLLGQASNGDIASTDYASDYAVKLLRRDNLQERSCYVLELLANSKKATYQRIEYWVDSDNFEALRADYFAVSGKLFKSAKFEYNNQLIVDDTAHKFISKIILSNAISNNQTTISYFEPQTQSISARTFDLRRLTR